MMEVVEMEDEKKDFWYWHSEAGREEARKALEKIFNNPVPRYTRELEEKIKKKIKEEEADEWAEHEKMIEEMMKL